MLRHRTTPPRHATPEASPHSESVAETLAAAIRNEEPGSDRYKALIVSLDELVRPPPAEPRPSKAAATGGIVGIIVALGLIAPTVQQMVSAFIGPGVDRVDAIEFQLNTVTAEHERTRATLADLIRYVERIEVEQAHANQRSPTLMPARLRALAAMDEIAAESN